VLWAGGAAPAALADLAARVRALLDAQGIRYDRRAFVPHVTLLRDLRREDAAAAAAAIEPPIQWWLDRAVLLRSAPDRQGSRYTEVRGAPARPC
jgi:2'-5' RNA ligase